ncbi:MAG: class I fructose-bisphosphate aldolase [Candidatus Saccharimonadales bacterium]
MNLELLEETCKALAAPGKGLLAADTSMASTKKRFDSVGVESTAETRGEYRGLLFGTPNIENYLTGVILFDETFWQTGQNGQLFRKALKSKGILPGIKVDKGLVDLPGFPGEKVTQGLDGLPEALQKYSAAGARFAKWRAVIAIGDGIPTNECVVANAVNLARYARLCQQENIVPIVEPEVLFDGAHSASQCEQTMAHTLDMLFKIMRAYRVHLPGAILKTSMVLPGKDSGTPIDPGDVAERTVRVLTGHVPKELGGVVFLSGGQTPNDAFVNLNRIVRHGSHPWSLTFSYDRALQDPVLKTWAKDRSNTGEAQRVFEHQLQLAAAACKGELDETALSRDNFVSKGQD